MNFSVVHEFLGLRRYRATHHWRYKDQPIDQKWLEKELRILQDMISHDPIKPSLEEDLLLQDKHRFWCGRQ